MNREERILIVDDDESTRKTLALIFAKKGYETEIAATGQEAMEKARGRFFNLALLDIKLPDIEGTELLPPLREMCPDMTMIMVTAYASLGTAVRALNKGASAYITKPLNMDEVLAVVREALEKQRLVWDKRQAEGALRVSHHFLQIANRHTEMLLLLKEFVAEVKNFTDCAAVGLRTLDEKGNIPYQAYEGFSYEFYESESPISIKSDQCMCINVIKGTTDPNLSFYTEGGSFYINGTTRFLATVSEEEKGQTRNVCNEVGYESVALVPIRLGERVLGLIHVADYQENMVPLEVVQVLEGAAMQLGAAIQRVQAEEEVQHHLQRIEALREIDRAITSTLDLTEVLNIILRELERVIPYHSAGIFLLSDGTARLAAGRGFPDMKRALQVSFPVEEDALTQELLKEKRPVVLADAQADERFRARGGTGYIRSWVGVPLIAKGRAVGFLTMDHREPGVYDEETVEMAQAFGSQVAIAIENARLYEEAQRELAERKRAEEELHQSFERLRRSLEGTVNVLVSAIEMRDPYTAGHQRQVTQLACAIAKEIGLTQEQIERLRMAGLIHDIGKITIPAEILSKPGRLSDLEWGMIQVHPRVGYDVLKTVDFPWPVAQIVLQHHERMNGSGYPQGLTGKDILIKARILAVADVVEAMSSHRPYRPARGLDDALEEISQNRGVLYAAEVVDACLKLFKEKRFEFE